MVVANNMIQFSLHDDVGALGTFEMFGVETLGQLTHKHAVLFTINEPMAQATSRHFHCHSTLCIKSQQDGLEHWMTAVEPEKKGEQSKAGCDS